LGGIHNVDHISYIIYHMERLCSRVCRRVPNPSKTAKSERRGGPRQRGSAEERPCSVEFHARQGGGEKKGEKEGGGKREEKGEVAEHNEDKTIRCRGTPRLGTYLTRPGDPEAGDVPHAASPAGDEPHTAGQHCSGTPRLGTYLTRPGDPEAGDIPHTASPAGDEPHTAGQQVRLGTYRTRPYANRSRGGGGRRRRRETRQLSPFHRNESS